VPPTADILNRIADVLNTSVDFLIIGDSEEKAKATLKNSELLNILKEIYVMPENEQNMLLHYVNAYIRDFKARKAYALLYSQRNEVKPFPISCQGYHLLHQ